MMINLHETENDERKPKKRNGFFNSIPQLPPCTTLKFPKNKLSPVHRKNSKTLLDCWALIQSRRKHEKRAVVKLDKTNSRRRSNSNRA